MARDQDGRLAPGAEGPWASQGRALPSQPEPVPARPDARALAHHARRRLGGPAPWLHAEVAQRMAARLPMIKRTPAQVFDWGAGAGASTRALREAYPQASYTAVEEDEAACAASAAVLREPLRPGRWWRWWRRPRASAVTVRPMRELGTATCDLLWSNMALHHAADVPAWLARWHAALATDGFLMFSTLGPGTLATLREIYGRARWPSPHAPFIDMHDLGDLMVQAGFAEPVMDQERLTLTWPDARALLAELRQLGGNSDALRFAGLRTPRWRARLEAALAERADRQGRIGLEFEIVYGHAFRPPPRARVQARTELSEQDMRQMLLGSRRRGGRPLA